MKRSKALAVYLLGALGQIIAVSVVVFFLRRKGVLVDYTTPIGLILILMGGASSALWGILMSRKYWALSYQTIWSDFFRIRQSYKNYLLMLFFLFLSFLPVAFGGTITIKLWYLPVLLFLKALVFGGIEELGWRYFFQPVLQERMHYVLSTVITFIAWGIWHFIYFYLEGTLTDVSVFSFLLGLLTNCFLLSALYIKKRNLWLCVMAHALINVFSQILSGGHTYVSYLCQAVIIVLSITLSLSESEMKRNSDRNMSRKLMD